MTYRVVHSECKLYVCVEFLELFFWRWLCTQTNKVSQYAETIHCAPSHRNHNCFLCNSSSNQRHWPFFFSTFFSGGLSGLRLGFSGLDLRETQGRNSDLCTFNFNEADLMKAYTHYSAPYCAPTWLATSPLTAWLSSLLVPSPFFLFSPSLSLFLPSSGCLTSWMVSLPFDGESTEVARVAEQQSRYF